MSATYTTQEVAGLLGVSDWALYEAVRRGNPPTTPIQVGRRIVWPKAAVDRLLDPERASTRECDPGSTANSALTNAFDGTYERRRHGQE